MGHMKDLDIRIRQGGDDAIAAVGELLPRWISVEERLPEEGDYCLVSLEDSLGIAWWHNEPTPKFIHEDIDNSWTPTHWMKLPEPPEVT
jgi:hypothetical protein